MICIFGANAIEGFMKYFKAITPTILLFIAAFLIKGCADTEQRPSSNAAGEFPETELFNSTIIFTAKDIRSTIIRAKYIAKYSGEKRAFGKSIDADFYDENGEYTSNLVADSGWIDEKSQKMEVRGDVVLINNEGAKLETQSLTWDSDIKKIVTDDFVRITRKNDILTGYGLRTDQKLENIEILRNIQGKVEELPEEDSIDGGK